MTGTGQREENMFRQKMNWKSTLVMGTLLLGVLAPLTAVHAQDDSWSGQRAAWLLGRADLETLALTGQRFEQAEIGGGGAADLPDQPEKAAAGRSGIKPGWTILASAILPGSGEAILGYKRGYLMMALDIFSWTQVAKYHNDGKDLTDDYYEYADAHYSDQLLVEGYNGGSIDPERSGEGAQYFPAITGITDVEDLPDHLPLYVTVEEDRREYYENLGKWDQFIFGWDDYLRPSFWGPSYGYEATGAISDLRQPWVSKHREIYRTMRDDANDAYKKRDRFMYFNIGLRVFSVFQVAYLNGLLGGDDGEMVEVNGHKVSLITEPIGLSRGTIGARVTF